MQNLCYSLPNIIFEHRQLNKTPKTSEITLSKRLEDANTLKQSTIHFGVTSQTLQLLLNKHDFIKVEIEDTLFDTEDAWFMENNYWVKLRKKNGTSIGVLIKHCIPEDQSIVSYQQTIDISLLKQYARKLRELKLEKDDFKLKIVDILKTTRYEFKLPTNSIIRVDVTKFSNDDYYMVGSMDYNAFVEHFTPFYEDIYSTIFGPVRSKIDEYLSCYQEEIYKSLQLSDNQQYYSQHGLNRYYSDPLIDNEQNKERIEHFFKLMGTENKSVYFVASREENKPLVEILETAYNYCELLVEEGVFIRTDRRGSNYD